MWHLPIQKLNPDFPFPESTPTWCDVPSVQHFMARHQLGIVWVWSLEESRSSYPHRNVLYGGQQNKWWIHLYYLYNSFHVPYSILVWNFFDPVDPAMEEIHFPLTNENILGHVPLEWVKFNAQQSRNMKTKTISNSGFSTELTRPNLSNYLCLCDRVSLSSFVSLIRMMKCGIYADCGELRFVNCLSEWWCWWCCYGCRKCRWDCSNWSCFPHGWWRCFVHRSWLARHQSNKSVSRSRRMLERPAHAPSSPCHVF